MSPRVLLPPANVVLLWKTSTRIPLDSNYYSLAGAAAACLRLLMGLHSSLCVLLDGNGASFWSKSNLKICFDQTFFFFFSIFLSLFTSVNQKFLHHCQNQKPTGLLGKQSVILASFLLSCSYHICLCTWTATHSDFLHSSYKLK